MWLYPQNTRDKTSARHAGRAYERRVDERLLWEFPTQFVPRPWLRIEKPGWESAHIQPDGFLLDLARRRITVLEVKLSHTPAAYFQLWEQYIPALRVAFGSSFSYFGVEICRNFVRGSHPVPVRSIYTLEQASATDARHTVFVGNRSWLRECGHVGDIDAYDPGEFLDARGAGRDRQAVRR